MLFSCSPALAQVERVWLGHRSNNPSEMVVNWMTTFIRVLLAESCLAVVDATTDATDPQPLIVEAAKLRTKVRKQWKIDDAASKSIQKPRA